MGKENWLASGLPGRDIDAMSETLFKFLLSELGTVRVRCMAARCGVVTELPIADLGRVYRNQRCPVCGTIYQAITDEVDHFAALSKAIAGMAAAKDTYQIEFVLPVKESP